jgi:hypothetical protein
MPEAMPEDLAIRWYDYWRRLSGTRAERKALEAGKPSEVVAAHDWVADRIEAGGLAAVEVLATLAAAAQDDGVIVAAGPIEDLLYTHGDATVDLLVDHARREPALAHALAHVSLADDSISPASLAKIERYRRH